jgi:hypothetical protein
MITVKQTAFLTYWSSVNSILRYIGEQVALFREAHVAHTLSRDPYDGVYFITTHRAEQD